VRYHILCLVVLFSISACRESEVGKAESDKDKNITLDRFSGSESGGHRLKDPKISDLEYPNNEEEVNEEEEVSGKTDLAVFLEEYSPSEGRKRLKRAFARSSDRVKLAQDLIKNYSGEDPAKGANVLSMVMRQWSGDFAAAVMGSSELHPSMQEKMISVHSSAQTALKNEKALGNMYSVLEPGGIRSGVAGKVARLSLSKGGINSALMKISDFDFQPERIQGVESILSHIHSQYVTAKLNGSPKDPTEVAFTSDDRQLVEKFIAEWDHTEKLQERLNKIEQYQSASDNGR
jgi:hypothetical protein